LRDQLNDIDAGFDFINCGHGRTILYQ
jgi:hypothetical protein